MQHFLAGVETVFARGFRAGSEGAQGRAARAGLYQLGAVHGNAVLPAGTGAFVARDLRRLGVLRRTVEAPGSASGAEEVDAGVRQWPPRVSSVPDGVGAHAGQVSGAGKPARRT